MRAAEIEQLLRLLAAYGLNRPREWARQTTVDALADDLGAQLREADTRARDHAQLAREQMERERARGTERAVKPYAVEPDDYTLHSGDRDE